MKRAASAATPAGDVLTNSSRKFVKTPTGREEPKSKKRTIELDKEQEDILKLRVDEILRIESGFDFVAHAKAGAIRLVGEMPTPSNVPIRMDITTNNFSVFLGRLNPPHKFHLISLITTILIARANGTKALFLFGNGEGPSCDDPLTFELKRDFIVSKLYEFGFVLDTDYAIDIQSRYFPYIVDFIKQEYKAQGGEVRLFHIGGDKPELRGLTLSLDVDKLKMPESIKTTTGKTHKINCIKVVIPSQTAPGSDIMSASLVRKTARETVRANPGNSDLAFRQWQERFTPMYDDAASSRPVFDQIIKYSCGVKQPSQGGSRRKRKRTRRNLKKLRSKRTIRNRYTRYKRRI
jgi:hypothetical protein